MYLHNLINHSITMISLKLRKIIKMTRREIFFDGFALDESSSRSWSQRSLESLLGANFDQSKEAITIPLVVEPELSRVFHR